MTAVRSAGVKAYISLSTPSTFDQSGYEALGDFTEIKGLERLSGHGPVWNTESHRYLGNSGEQVFKTNRSGGTLNMTLALNTDDAGQIKLKSARDSATTVASIKLTYPNGDDYYCQLVVTDFRPNPDTQGSKQMAEVAGSVTVGADSDVDWVEVLA